jgi:hypothetical protein
MKTEQIDNPETKPIEPMKGVEPPKPEEDVIFDEKKHFPIFPTNLFEFEFNKEEKGKLDSSLPESLDKMGDKDSPNWATDFNLQNLEDFKPLSEVLSQSAQRVLGFMGVRFETLMLTSLRGYKVTKSELSPMEVRPNNLLAGIYCLKGTGGRVTFYDPRPQAWIIKPPVSSPNIFNSDAFSMDLKEGKVMVFPAWLQYQATFSEEMTENMYFTWSLMARGPVPKTS